MKRACLLGVLISFLATSLQAEMIGHYKFDGDTTDASGKGNDGTAEGDAAPDAAGLMGGAYRFSGAGHVNVPIDMNPGAIADATVTMWVKADDAILGAPGLYKTFGHDDGGWDRTFGLDNREGEYRYAAFTGGARPGPTPTTGTPITSDWTFLAAVWDTDNPDAGSNTVTFYANGNSVTETLNNTPSAHMNAAIGSLRPDNFAEGFQGLIDDVRIFDTALTANEVAAVQAQVPEPASATLLALGVLGLLRVRRRR